MNRNSFRINRSVYDALVTILGNTITLSHFGEEYGDTLGEAVVFDTNTEAIAALNAFVTGEHRKQTIASLLPTL